MKAIFHKCYDDYGNLKDNALNIAYNLGKKEGLRKGKKLAKEEVIEEYNKSLKEHWIEEEDLNLSDNFFDFADRVAKQLKKGE